MSQQSLLHDAEGASGSGLYGTTREFDEIIRALNTYSIVAITDRRGVIVHVNDRFCEISKYERHELIGGTHRLINSGHHPKAYFQEMWRAIGRGEMWNGEICNRAKDGSEYWVDTTIIPLPDEQGRPERYIAIRTEETQRHFAEEQAHRLAFFDGLTGLPNHGSLVKTIGDCTNTQVTGELSGLMIVGIDDLSHVVEAFGYEVGNRLLLDAAERLGELCGSEVTLARNSAGTFGVLLPSLGMDECEARNSVEQFADEVFGAFAGETALGDGVVIEGSVSVGYVLWSDAETHTSHDEDGCLVTVDPYNVLNAANLARKQAARIGGHRSAQRFRSGMVSDSQQRLRFASELRRGMDRGELRLFSQPIVDRDRRVTGVEGLIRWSNPERGMVPPVDFIPLAEQTGLIVEIGEWVLHQACLILAEWQSNPQLRDLKFSINVSPRELHLSEFGDRVRGIVREHGVPADKLLLEVTESALHADVEGAARVLSKLRDEGIATALDDFGTGYSSLNYLHRLPVQQLKIDRSFVLELGGSSPTSTIVEAIAFLGRKFDLEVVAEGIETEARFEQFRDLGIDAFQGFLFSQPVPVDEAVARITADDILAPAA